MLGHPAYALTRAILALAPRARPGGPLLRHLAYAIAYNATVRVSTETLTHSAFGRPRRFRGNVVRPADMVKVCYKGGNSSSSTRGASQPFDPGWPSRCRAAPLDAPRRPPRP